MAVEPHPDTVAFLSALFGYAPEGKHTMLWTLQDKRSAWFELGEEGAPHVIAAGATALGAEGMDVYIAVSCSDEPYGPRERISSANSSGIMGLWADIDIADRDVHKKWNLPPDEKGARELLEAAGLEPSLLIHSGHGLQAWWLFDEFWSFDTEADRLRAAALAQRWNTTLRVHAAQKGWTIDSTFDLARVMRVPGTMNRKGSPVVPVRLLEVSDKRYTEDHFDSKLVDEKLLVQAGITSAESYVSDDIEINDASAPDLEKFQALMANDERFAATFNRKRRDLPDQSPSSYDMSLASQLAWMGTWTDQEIAECIFFFRRHHTLDVEKARRVDYLKRTIEKARNAVQRATGDEVIEEAVEALERAVLTGDDEDQRVARRAIYDWLGTKFGFKIVQFIKYTSEPPSYRLVTPTASVNLGDGDNLLRWDRFRRLIFDGLRELIDRFKPAEWDRICDHMLRSFEEQDVGLEATSHGEMLSWLSQYLASHPPVSDVKEAAASEYPFVDERGRTLLFGHGFRRWLYVSYQERMTNPVMGARLRAFGCESDTVNIETESGKRTSRSVWRLPAEGLK